MKIDENVIKYTETATRTGTASHRAISFGSAFVVHRLLFENMTKCLAKTVLAQMLMKKGKNIIKLLLWL